jgi:hypothetical protein
VSCAESGKSCLASEPEESKEERGEKPKTRITKASRKRMKGQSYWAQSLAALSKRSMGTSTTMSS